MNYWLYYLYILYTDVTRRGVLRLQVIPVDTYILESLTSQQGGCEQLTGITHMIILNGDKTPNKKLTVMIPCFGSHRDQSGNMGEIYIM